MPELPELEAVRLTVGPKIEGRTVEAVEVNPRKGFLLRAPIPQFQTEPAGRKVAKLWRRGKHLIFDMEGAGDCTHLVINPMLGGRFQLTAPATKRGAAFIFAFRLDSGDELRYLDFRDMGRVYWARNLETDVPAWPDLGPEADELPQHDIEWFRKRIKRYRAALKDVLREQAFLSGIGNAYSDEILFEAQLLPLRKRSSLKPDDEERLYGAITAVLNRAIEAILANPDYDESKQNRSFMKVHGKGGQDCPRCGHRISQIGSDREPMNFCRGCQF
ncbi:MAG TPA: DNA-formamidopyrimidine glycosylase family protein [Chloroflexota bacterium]|nr:DNA-formamidopyrimidine glycosylase family protein [Chloroflexota bacterium]